MRTAGIFVHSGSICWPFLEPGGKRRLIYDPELLPVSAELVSRTLVCPGSCQNIRRETGGDDNSSAAIGKGVRFYPPPGSLSARRWMLYND
ncbi:MAG: hypothetical protein N2A40_04100 [Desulfobulbaceae bacterium]